MVTKEQLDMYTKAWSQGNQLIDDSTFDSLVEEYVKEHGEEARPFTRQKQSSAVNDIVGTLPKVYNVRQPMRSGQKTYKDWIESMEKAGKIKQGQKICLQCKFDGISVAYDYYNHRFFTRGDYDNGESMDVTDLFKGKCRLFDNNRPSLRSIKFEAIMPDEAFYALGLDKGYVNPRAALSALVMSRNRDLIKDCVHLEMLRHYRADNQMYLDDVELPQHSIVVDYNDYDAIEEFINSKLEAGAKEDICNDLDEVIRHEAIDGVVVSFFETNELGDYIVEPGEIAIKILNNVKETKIKAIEWQMGKTGKITPVGILEPVTFDNGVTVDHVGLSTFERVYDLNLHFDETVRVMHNIVPYLLDGKGDGGMRIPTPTKCPACGHNLDMRNLRTIRCTNPECQNKKLGDIIRYCETMKMMGVSKGILTKLYDLGYVKSIPDLYKIDYQRLALEKGFAETSCNAIRKSIEGSSVNVTPDQWFGALPCLNVSQKTWKTIFDTRLRDDEGFFNVLIDEIDNDDCEGFLQTLIQPIIGIGPATWGAIAEGFRNNWKDIRETIYHIRFLLEYDEKKGELICLSGTRDSSLINALTLAGYRVTDDWSSEVNILLIPHEGYMSSKVKKALKHMVPIYTTDDALLNIINHGKIK